MKFRPLGRTGLKLPWLSFGASSLGQEFRTVDLDEALRSVRVALDLGMNFIDTSPFYGRGMSECLLGVGPPGRPARLAIILGTKLGRYDRGPLRLLGPPGRRERRRQPAPDGRRPPRHHALPRHRVRRDVADRRGDAAGPPQDPGAGQGPVHRRQRLPDEDVPLRPRPHRPRRDPLVQPLHAPEHDARRPRPLPEGEGGRDHERRPVLGPAPDQRPAAALAQGHARGPRDLPTQAAEHCASKGVDIAQLALAILARQRGHGHLRRRLGQPRERPEVGRVGRHADRPGPAGRGPGDPRADPQLVLHRRPAREQRPAAPSLGV